VLRRHGGTQPTHLQRSATGSVRALSEVVGRKPEATVSVVGATVVLLADPVGRQTADSCALADIQQAPQTVPGDQGRLRGQYRIVVVEFVFGRERTVQSGPEEKESRFRRRPRPVTDSSK